MGKYFPAPRGDVVRYCNKPADFAAHCAAADQLISPELAEKLARAGRPAGVAGDVKYVFLTKCGPGPLRQSASEHIIEAASGLPLPASSAHVRLQIQ